MTIVKSLLDLPGSTMTVGDVGHFVDCSQRDDKDKSAGKTFSFDDKVADELNSSGRLFKRRLDIYKGSCSFTVGCLCIMLSRDQYDIIMWAWTVSVISRRIGKEVDFDTFVDHFRNGIPNYEQRKKLWQSYDSPLGNLYNLPHLIDTSSQVIVI